MKIRSLVFLAMTMAFGIALSADRDFVSVKGTGTGITETEALKDAYRDAVETAVGLYVDAEQMVKNDEIVEDKILTQSNAYIESYDVLKKSTANGVCTIKILAKVRTKALTMAMSTMMKTQTIEVGDELQNLYANEVTKKKSGKEGAALLKNLLDKLDPGLPLIDVTLADAKPVALYKDVEGNEQKFAYLFKQTISEERYFNEFMPKLREVLTQVAVAEPVKASLSVSERKIFDLAKCFNGAPYSSDRPNCIRGYSCDASVSLAEIGEMYCSTTGGPFGLCKNPQVVLVTQVNKLKTVYACEIFEVDQFAAQVFDDWQRKIRPSDYDNLFAQMRFVDESGEDLVLKRVKLGLLKPLSSCDIMGCYERGKRHRTNKFMAFVPWFASFNGFERYDWGKISLPKEALPLIKQIKVDIVK